MKQLTDYIYLTHIFLMALLLIVIVPQKSACAASSSEELEYFADKLLGKIERNPGAVLREVRQVRRQWEEQMQRNGFGADDSSIEVKEQGKVLECLERLKGYDAKMPIFLLDECTTVGGSYLFNDCVFSRFYNPEYRLAYEEKVSKLLLERMNEDQAAHYVSF